MSLSITPGRSTVLTVLSGSIIFSTNCNSKYLNIEYYKIYTLGYYSHFYGNKFWIYIAAILLQHPGPFRTLSQVAIFILICVSKFDLCFSL